MAGERDTSKEKPNWLPAVCTGLGYGVLSAIAA